MVCKEILMSTQSTYYQSHRKEVIPLLPTHYSTVLEIGCGEGNFRSNLTQESEYWGVEPVKAAAKIADRKLDTVLIGTYQEKLDEIPDNYFDLVICNDVIEHMIDHDAFFQSIKSKIKHGGCLVSSVPNVRFIRNLTELLFKKDWQYKEEGILDRTHLRFFTEKSLKRTISDNGFVIDKFIGISPIRNSILKSFIMLLLGNDIRYLQFGIRIKCA